MVKGRKKGDEGSSSMRWIAQLTRHLMWSVPFDTLKLQLVTLYQSTELHSSRCDIQRIFLALTNL